MCFWTPTAMKQGAIPELYKRYHIDRDYENLSLFERLASEYRIQSFLYPGSFVHIAPSFFMPRAVYVDSSKAAKKFFDDPQTIDYIRQKKVYDQEPTVTFYHQSYEDPIQEPEASFDLLISQHAGLVSEAAKRYLRTGGILVANNSHGDAGLASIDSDFEFVAVTERRGKRLVLFDRNLDQYFIPKTKTEIAKERLRNLARGLGYTKTATNYVFRRLS